MARRRAAVHKSRKQKRGIQAAVRSPIRMVKRYPSLVHGNDKISEPSAVLAPEVNSARWFLWRCEFLHVKHSTRHVETLRVWHQPSDTWSAGEAMAKRDGKELIAQLTEDPENYVLLGVVCMGADPNNYES